MKSAQTVRNERAEEWLNGMWRQGKGEIGEHFLSCLKGVEKTKWSQGSVEGALPSI